MTRGIRTPLEATGRRSFRYVYDFGDNWDHSVKIEEMMPGDPQLAYPRLLNAIGERPPEDSGGPWGYAEFLQALHDPAHEYHDEAVEQLGEDHDPNKQPDTGLIGQRLAALANRWASKTRRPP